jgi:hypothetical protein
MASTLKRPAEILFFVSQLNNRDFRQRNHYLNFLFYWGSTARISRQMWRNRSERGNVAAVCARSGRLPDSRTSDGSPAR